VEQLPTNKTLRVSKLLDALTRPEQLKCPELDTCVKNQKISNYKIYSLSVDGDAVLTTPEFDWPGEMATKPHKQLMTSLKAGHQFSAHLVKSASATKI
jgi:hypothetical protein